MKEFLFLVGAILLLAVIMSCVISSDYVYMNKYCAERNYKVVSIEHYVFSTGPFSIFSGGKNTRIYKVVTNKNTTWFRFGLWTETIEESDNGI